MPLNNDDPIEQAKLAEMGSLLRDHEEQARRWGLSLVQLSKRRFLIARKVAGTRVVGNKMIYSHEIIFGPADLNSCHHFVTNYMPPE